MPNGRKLILSPLLGIKNEKLGIRLGKNICPKKTKFSWNRHGDYITKQQEWLEVFWDNKTAFLQDRGS